MIKSILTVDNFQEALTRFPTHLDGCLIQEQSGPFYYVEGGKAFEVPQAIGWFIVQVGKVQREMIGLTLPPVVSLDGVVSQEVDEG